MKYYLIILSIIVAGCGSSPSPSTAPVTVVPAPVATPSPTPRPSPTPSPTPIATPTPTPTPSPTPVFTALSCNFISGNVNCTGANLGTEQVALNFSPYLATGPDIATQIVSAQIENNLGPGEFIPGYSYTCPLTDYDGMVDCTCFVATIQTFENGNNYLGYVGACGNGVNTSTNWLTDL